MFYESRNITFMRRSFLDIAVFILLKCEKDKQTLLKYQLTKIEYIYMKIAFYMHDMYVCEV